MIHKLLISNYHIPINDLTFSFKNENNILTKKKYISTLNSYPFTKKLITNFFFKKKEFFKKFEIEKEKRKRLFLYKLLNYYLSNITYFDFFSPNCFKYIINLKLLIHNNKNKNLSLFLFYLIASQSLNVKTYKYSNNFIKNYFYNNKIKKETLIFNNNNIIKYFLIHKYFLLCIYNNINKFKNPIINSKLFLIYLIENNSDLIELFFKYKLNKFKLNTIKYFLLKQLYNHEIIIKNQIKQKNNYFFVYLFKTYFSEEIVNKLIKMNKFNNIVLLFRNKLIKYILNSSIFNSFDMETYIILLNFSKRYYL